MRSLSPLDKLPEAIKQELDKGLLNPVFSINDCLQWLAEKGHQSSKSALHRRRTKLTEATDLLDWLKKRGKPEDLKNAELFELQAILTPFEKLAELVRQEISKRYDVEGRS